MATDSSVRSQASASKPSQTRLQPQDSSHTGPAFSATVSSQDDIWEDDFTAHIGTDQTDTTPNRLTGERLNLRPLSAEEQAYRNGYASGRNHETYNQAYLRQSDRDQARANANAAASGGWLLGISMAAIIGLVGATVYSLYAANSAAPGDSAPAVVAPPPSANAPEAPARVEKQTSVIERTVERLVPPTELRVNVQSPPAAEPAPASTATPVAPAPAASSSPAASAPADSAPAAASTESNTAEPDDESTSTEMPERATANPID